jgi:2-polyprenyl-3-methyl-5-hydroxy-6-metoxy-1,4-benzoquinol methylase
MSNKKLKDTYNKIAEEWHQDHQSDDWWQEGTDKFVLYLKESASVLDVGCGGGTKSRYLAGKGLNVLGIDFSEKMVEIASREVPAAKFQVMDVNDIDTLGENFDGIFMQAVLLHIPKKKVDEILRKAAQKLNPGGYLYIAVKEKMEEGIDEEVKKENDYGYEYERFFSYFTIDELRQHLKNVGLEVVYEDVKPPSRTARKSN